MALLHVIAAAEDKAELLGSLPVHLLSEADPLSAPEGSLVWLRPEDVNIPAEGAPAAERERWEKVIHRISVWGTVVQLVRAATFGELHRHLDQLKRWQSEVRPRVQPQARQLDLVVIVTLSWEPTEAELKQLDGLSEAEGFPLRGLTVYWLGSQLRVSWLEGSLIHARSVWARLVATLLYRLLLRPESSDVPGSGWFAWRSLEIRGSLASPPVRQRIAAQTSRFAEMFFGDPGEAERPTFQLTITPPQLAAEDSASMNQIRLAAFVALGESNAATCVTRDLDEDQFEAWRQQTAASFRGQLSKCHRMLTAVSADRGLPADNSGWSLKRQWEIAEKWKPHEDPHGGPGYFARLSARLAGLTEDEWNTANLARTQFRDWQKSQSRDDWVRHRGTLLAKAAQLDLAHAGFVGLGSRIAFASVAVLIVAFGVAALVDVWASFWLQSGAWTGGTKRGTFLVATFVFSAVGSILGALLPHWLELRAGRRGGKKLAEELRGLREAHRAQLVARATLCCGAAEAALKNRAAGRVRHTKRLVERAYAVVAPVIQDVRLRLTGTGQSPSEASSSMGSTSRVGSEPTLPTGDLASYKQQAVCIVSLIEPAAEPEPEDNEAEAAWQRQASEEWGDLGKRLDPERTGRLPHVELDGGVRDVMAAYEKCLSDALEKAALQRLASQEQLPETLTANLVQRLDVWLPEGGPMVRGLMSCQVEDGGGVPAKATVTYSGVGALHEWLRSQLEKRHTLDCQPLTPLALDANKLRSEHGGLWLGLVVEEVPITLRELSEHMTWVLQTQAPRGLPGGQPAGSRPSGSQG